MTQKPTKNGLVIFMRNPIPGKVKTRLSKALGEVEAASIYQYCVDSIIGEVSKVDINVDKYIFVDEKPGHAGNEHLSGLRFQINFQEGKDLGERLANSFRHLFGNGFNKVIIVASDTPDLNAVILEDAINKLDEYDIVIGPSDDGGYYLIGMKAFHQQLFNGILWGTEHVYRQTVKVAAGEGLTMYPLQTLIDIDTEDDLQKWRNHSRNNK
jgi:uncharacterized protein